MSLRLKSYIYLIILSIIWGSSFILIKYGLQDFSGKTRLTPEYLGALRLSIAFLILIPFGVSSLNTITKKQWFYLAIIGIIGNGIPTFLFAYAQTTLSSAETGILNSTVPIFTIIIAVIFYKFSWKIKHIIGICFGIIGTFLIINGKGINSLSFDNVFAIILVILASLCYAISLTTIKYKTKDLSPKLITSASFYFVGIPCLIYLLFSDFGIFIKDNPNSIDGIYSIIILAVICTAFAVLLFNRMIQISSPVFASSITFTIPVVALVIGFYNKEEINFIQIIGMCTILTGVFFINKK